MEQYDVFISYSRKDTEIVYKIEEEFKKNKISYFIDREGIGLGEAFARKIGTCIKNCNIVLFVWTESSNQSMYASKEISLAIHWKKTIVPFMIGSFEADDSLMFNLSDCNSIECDKISDTDIKHLVTGIYRILDNLKTEQKSTITNPSVDTSTEYSSYTYKSVLKVETDTECRVFIDKKDYGIVNPSQIKSFELCPGSYHLRFESLSDESCFVEDPKFNLSEHKEEIYNVKLKNGFNIFSNHLKTTISETLKKFETASSESGLDKIKEFAIDVCTGRPIIKYLVGQIGSSMSPALLFSEGEKYYYGRGETRNYDQAAAYFVKAAQEGNTDAMNNLGICFEYGRGFDQDYAKAVFWYRKAAEQGNVAAINSLSTCYEKGLGVEKNKAIADKLHLAETKLSYGKTKQALELIKEALSPRYGG